MEKQPLERRERRCTAIEQSLLNIQGMLSDGDQGKVYPIRTRLDGLINAYKDDIESMAILHLLMAEYTLKSKIEMETRYGIEDPIQ